MYSTIPIHWNIKSAPASPGRSRVGPALYVFSLLGLNTGNEVQAQDGGVQSHNGGGQSLDGGARANIPTVLEYWPRMVEYSLNTDSEVQARMVEYSRGQTAVQCWSHTAVDYRPTILVQPQ
jgi:hypothetical protein